MRPTTSTAPCAIAARSAPERHAAGRRRIAAAVLLAGLALAAAGCSLTAAEQATLPHTYLEQARHAADARDAAGTIAALDKAQSAWEGANTPYGNPQVVVDPDVLREIARARQSVQMQRWGDAQYYIGAALSHPSTINPD